MYLMYIIVKCLLYILFSYMFCMDVHGRLRETRENAGYAFAKEAARAFGWNENTYSSHENGNRGVSATAAKKYAAAYGVSLDWLLEGKGESRKRTRHGSAQSTSPTLPASPNATIGEAIEFTGQKIPVYGRAVGGVNGEFEWNGEVFDYVICPPTLSEVSNAYAVYVAGDSMAPRYEEGEVIYINPRRNPKRGDYVVAQIQVDEHGPPHAFVKRLVRWSTAALVLQQFNPPKEMEFDGHQVVSVHVVVLGGER